MTTMAGDRLREQINYLESRYPELLHGDELDFTEILVYGLAKGYDANNWCEPDGKRCSRKENFDSMSHHLAHTFLNHRYDDAPGGSFHHHSLHLQCRAYFQYHRDNNGIVHPEDKYKVKDET